MHRVVILALDGVYPFELGIPSRVFGAADGRYEVLTCTLTGAPVRTNADFSVAVEHDAGILRTADTVVIPSSDLALISREPSPAVRTALESVRPGTRTVSICTGAFVLASLGLLDGRPATTHWAVADVFRDWFPAVDLNPGVLFVDDGDILTSAGAASGLDLCLHLIRSDHGAALANSVARSCVVPPWRDGGQAQYIDHPVPEEPSSSTAATRDWALHRLHEPLTLPELAGHATMSLRTFARRFTEEVGTSPGRWLTHQRITRARHLLETTDLPITEVAAKSGFTTPASLRQHLHSQIGVSPQTYRKTFGTPPNRTPT